MLLLNSPQQLVLQTEAVNGTFLQTLNKQVIHAVTLSNNRLFSEFDEELLEKEIEVLDHLYGAKIEIQLK